MQAKKELRRRKPAQTFSEAFISQVIDEYLSTGQPKVHIQQKHGILFRSAIHTWMKQRNIADIHVKTPYLDRVYQSNQEELSKKYDPKKGAAALEDAAQQRIRELEKQLEEEKLRSEAYRRMIDIAEQELKIPIRKKSVTK